MNQDARGGGDLGTLAKFDGPSFGLCCHSRLNNVKTSIKTSLVLSAVTCASNLYLVHCNVTGIQHVEVVVFALLVRTVKC